MYLYPLNVHAHIMLCELVVKLRLEVCRLLAVGCQDVSAFKTIANVWFVYCSTLIIVCYFVYYNQWELYYCTTVTLCGTLHTATDVDSNKVMHECSFFQYKHVTAHS